MPRLSEVTIETDPTASTGYALHWNDFSDTFGTPESIELFRPVTTFRFISIYGDFVARQEHRGSRPYWYGFKRISGQVRKIYLGRHHRLTLHRLEEAAAQLHSLARPLLPN